MFPEHGKGRLGANGECTELRGGGFWKTGKEERMFLFCAVLSKEALDNFIEGQSSELTDLQPPHQHSSTMSDVCYILADDALKAMDNQ